MTLVAYGLIQDLTVMQAMNLKFSENKTAVNMKILLLLWSDSPNSGPRPPNYRGFMMTGTTHSDSSGRVIGLSQRRLPDNTPL